MSNQQWRIAMGAVNALCAYLLIQPQVQAYPLVLLVLGAIVTVVGFLKAGGNDATEGE